jgi:hypothetical protein
MKIPTDTLNAFARWSKESPEALADDSKRRQRQSFFAKWTAERLAKASRDDLVELFTPLWSMAMWGSKSQYVDQCIGDNGLEKLSGALADLLHGPASLEVRWDAFRSKIKRVGPSMASELLAHVHPDECLPWTAVTREVFLNLGWPHTPKYNYQLDGKLYRKLCEEGKAIGKQLAAAGVADSSVMRVNYFIWWLAETQKVELKQDKTTKGKAAPSPQSPKAAEFLHNEIRDKLADIGKWLGFVSRTEVTVAAGARVDTIWEATIGNMGRVIYVFEVQTKGSIDSLMVNLLKALNNPAVQGVVAVSDTAQITKITSHVKGLAALAEKLKTWNYEEVLQVHESLAMVNEKINALGLVPEGF